LAIDTHEEGSDTRFVDEEDSEKDEEGSVDCPFVG
jgi:hypothetical protein